jgi:EAL domain-containing protein (putative c-di-GMP-specific phosphodiesterase class I)/CHASE2 domain-containing sensor protein
MRWLRRKDRSQEARRFPKMLIWALVLGLLYGLGGGVEYFEDGLRNARNRINQRDASGDIVLVAIDEKALREVGRWPWPRGRYADLIDAIGRAEPKQQVHDFMFPDKSVPAEDAKLAKAFERNGNVTLGFLHRAGARDGTIENSQPLQIFSRHARVASISVWYNYADEVWQIPYSARVGSKRFPSLASAIADVRVDSDSSFRVNYAFRPNSIHAISAADLLNGKADLGRLKGKTVVVGPVSFRLGDQHRIPGWGDMGGVYINIIGAETLKAGRPVDLGWLPGFLLAAIVAIAAIRVKGRHGAALLAGASITLLTVPIALERAQIFTDITSGLFVVIWVAAGLAIRSVKRSGLTNAVSGLPNLLALRKSDPERDRPLVVARIINYPQIVSTLTPPEERSLIEQIVARLKVGSEISTVYQGDEGIFAWSVHSGIAIGHHVEALAALFRSPAKVAGKAFDIAVSFGVEIGSGRTVANRLQSALVAADEATAEGLRWKYHDPERLKDAEWRLSLLSQLDHAIDAGEVWVAYQPQVELKTNRIRGAEALARWTHPEKGPISPSEFIVAAEQNDRIEKLTLFVLDQAVEAAARINRDHGPVDMAVNLSARMLGDKALPSKVRAILDRHQLHPERLTLELTETATLANGADIGPLYGLRDLGVCISIDDYGTGLSTLEYLKKIPASEIKIDQSFVKSMRDHRSDLVMVQSTIALAHSLGRTVVAEGVESREILDMLVAMKCEIAQGFIIGRPGSLTDLTKRLASERKRQAA